MSTIPRPEYPRPQFQRPDWLCLNGEWEFEFDPGDSGEERGLLQRPLRQTITVPFVPECRMSGIGDTDFHLAVWYRRTISIPSTWSGQRVLLHFGAVDYDTTVWVNGIEVGRHRGGYTPFSFEITSAIKSAQEATIVVRARDDWREPKPRGKQSTRLDPDGCLYPRNTGIWQTVWLEPVPQVYLQRTRILPDVAGGAFDLIQPILGNADGWRIEATLLDSHGQVSQTTTECGWDLLPRLRLSIPTERRRFWSPEDPHLYDLTLRLLDREGREMDQIQSYAGFRSLSIHGTELRLNGKRLFQKLVLDQGYYPDSLITAPSDEALKQDIQLALDAGFNGARLHQKVFEERFLYHADHMGYLVWGEFGDWGVCHPDLTGPRWTTTHVTQWVEAVERDLSHPSIIGWCPMNETWEERESRIMPLDDLQLALFLATKAIDPTRPIIDSSGFSHRVPQTDLYSGHKYTQLPTQMRDLIQKIDEGKPERWSMTKERPGAEVPYQGQPYLMSEFGGIWWNPDAKPGENSWGYGDRPQTIEEFYTRFEGLCQAILASSKISGYCYTQLTDVFQEQNGIYTFDRKPKFELTRIRAAQKQ